MWLLARSVQYDGANGSPRTRSPCRRRRAGRARSKTRSRASPACRRARRRPGRRARRTGRREGRARGIARSCGSSRHDRCCRRSGTARLGAGLFDGLGEGVDASSLTMQTKSRCVCSRIDGSAERSSAGSYVAMHTAIVGSSAPVPQPARSRPPAIVRPVSSTSVAGSWSAEASDSATGFGSRDRRPEYKLKYAGSVFGYAWSIVKPLALFTVLYLVFARSSSSATISDYYAVSLLIGIVLFGSSRRHLPRHDVARRPGVAPAQAGVPTRRDPDGGDDHAGLTFLVNSVVVAGFVAWEQVTPRLDWLLVPAALELYCFIARPGADPRKLFVRSATWARSGARAAAALLRLSDHLPIGFLRCSRDYVSQPVHAGAPGHQGAGALPGSAWQHDHRGEAFETFGRLSRSGSPRRRSSSACSSSGRAVVRGAREHVQ